MKIKGCDNGTGGDKKSRTGKKQVFVLYSQFPSSAALLYHGGSMTDMSVTMQKQVQKRIVTGRYCMGFNILFSQMGW